MKTHIPKKVTVHCSVTTNNKHVDPEVIRKEHLARGFDGIGYHILIQPDGEAQAVRPLNQVGMHVSGMNTGNIGICLIGNDKFTVKQFDSLRYQLDSLKRCFNMNPWSVYCHRQFPTAITQGKTCPNIEINNLLCWYFTGDMKAIDEYLLKG